SDCQDTAAAAVYELGLVDGYDDGTFQPDRLITRQEVFKMIYNLLLLDGHDQGIDPEQAGIMLSNYNDSPGASHWSAVPIATLLNLGIAQGVNDHTLGMSGNTSRLQAIALTYRYLENPVNAAARQPAIPTIPEGSSVATEFLPEPAASQDPLAASKDVLDRLGYQDEKYVLVFGSLEQPRYTSAEEAAPNMVEITVPVWALKSSGEKYATQKTLLVHNAIADRVALVFADIYAGAEQFPIKNVGGYAWRGGKSEHNWGLAIDINYEENYQIYPNGTVACGKYWLPGEDPYSIPANGDVVQAFRKHGFAWGGNAWKSNHDYMHFSYFGN
ncbi:MAG: M15 family metallopeptidase, partial [Clostridiales bacterium]